MQMETKEFYIVENKRIFLKKKISSFKLTKVVGPLAFLILNYMILYGKGIDLELFVLIYSFLSAFTIVGCVFLAQNALSKLHKIVHTIKIKESNIYLISEVNSVSIPLNQIRFNRGVVTVINKDFDALIITRQGFSYHIILDFFEDNILQNLTDVNLA